MEIQKRPVFVLVSSPATEESESCVLGAACIGAALLSAHLVSREDLIIIDDSMKEPIKNLCARIIAKNPDIIGFSLYCWNSSRYIDAACWIRNMRPDISILAGGPDAERLILRNSAKLNFDSKPVARDIVKGVFDAIFLGESETSIVQWMLRRQATTKYQLGEIVEEKPTEPGALSSPWLSRVLLPLPHASIAWELSRGCPYRCAYCYEGRGKSGISSMPESRIREELDLFVRRGVSEIFVLDPTFNADTGRALSLLGLFADVGRDIHWNFEIRAELLTESQAEAFSMLDCSLQIGLQSAIPEVSARIGRKLDTKKFAAKIKLLDEEGLIYGFDLIYGLPGDSIEGFKTSIDFAISLAPNHLDIFRLAVLPGTDLYNKKVEYELNSDEDPPYLLTSHPTFSRMDMQKAEKLAAAVRVFYTQGRAVPWFLAILSPPKLSPSSFFDELLEMPFPLSLDGGDGGKIGHSVIEKAQCDALSLLYRKRGCAQCLPAALDLVRFHGAWSRAFAEHESSIVELHYPAELVGSYDMLDIEAVANHRRISQRRIQIRPSSQGPTVKAV